MIEGKLAEWLPDRIRQQDDRVRIETTDGRKITVPMYQLSSSDQEWLRNHLALNNKLATNDSSFKPGTLIRVECFDPKELLVPPAGTSFDRTAIPSRGAYENAGSDAENIVTNHLFWLCKAGYTRMAIGRDENRTWEKLNRKADGLFGSGGGCDPDRVADYAAKSLEREGKGIISLRQWKPKLVPPAAFDAISGTPAMLLFEGRAYHKNEYKWSYVFPVLEAKGRSLTLFYRGERVRTSLADLTAEENKGSSVQMPDGSYHNGYKLVFDPGDSSKLVKNVVNDKLDIRIEPGSFRIVDLELSPPTEQKR